MEQSRLIMAISQMKVHNACKCFVSSMSGAMLSSQTCKLMLAMQVYLCDLNVPCGCMWDQLYWLGLRRGHL